MRVVCFIDCLGAGGAQRQLIGLAVFLKQRGYDVQVVVYHNISFFSSYLEENNVAYVVLQGASKIDRRILIVSKYFRRQRPDWVIAYQESPSVIACLAKMLGGKFRLIVSERSTTQSFTWREKLRFYLYRYADWIVPNSHTQELIITSHYPQYCLKNKAITNFVDLERFHPIFHDRKSVPEIVVAASIWPPKNTIGFIEALRLLKDKHLDFHVSWYGVNDERTPYVEECQQKIEKYGLISYISLLRKSKEIDNVYQSADYFCLPSFYEGTPNVICEAMATGLPIICSDVCDNGIYVKEGENGTLFDPKTPQSIADAIEKALNLSAKDYVAFCEKSRAMAEELLLEDRFVENYIQLIEQ